MSYKSDFLKYVRKQCNATVISNRVTIRVVRTGTTKNIQKPRAIFDKKLASCRTIKDEMVCICFRFTQKYIIF